MSNCLSTAVLVLAILPNFAGEISAQTVTGKILGIVSDPTGARISDAIVSAQGADGKSETAKTDPVGAFELQGLRPGDYVVTVTARGFEVASRVVRVAGGESQKLDIELAIAKRDEKIDVTGEASRVDTEPANNANAIVLKEKDLEMLSEDPDELKLQLQMLAGAVGGQGGQIYVDGFAGGRLPPKSAIRQIRINQDPYSAEYETPGIGRIEVLTKPGGAQFRSLLSFWYNNAKLNSTSPFLTQRPAYQTGMFSGSLGGPLTKKSSFQLDIDWRNVDDSSIVTALILDGSFNPINYSQAIPNPRLLAAENIRVDSQINASNIFFARYEYSREKEKNDGTGQLYLPSQAFDINKSEHTFQISDTMILSSRMTNETKLQYKLVRVGQTPRSGLPQVSVLGAFIGGGSNLGGSSLDQQHCELQNNTSIDEGKHFLRFGGLLRLSTETERSTANFNGTFIFSSLKEFQTTQRGLSGGLSAEQIRAGGGGAEQFSITIGRPSVSGTMLDAGVFFLDNWRVRPNVIVAYGLRYETQNEISDHMDFAPRLSLAWAFGRGQKASPRNVVRLGVGVFYARFAQGLALNARQLNGQNQRQVIFQDPNFYPSVPDLGTLEGSVTAPTIYRIDPNLGAPYLLQSSFSYERQLPKDTRLAITYLNSRGGRQLLSTNINAPLPGTFDISNPSSGIRPFPNSGNIYEYESRGRFEQNQLTVNVAMSGLRRARLTGSYAFGYVNSNTAGPGSFPSNQFDISQDYGRASYDVRHQFDFGGTVDLPFGFYMNPLILFTSGQPYNITVGQDLNGDSIFNDRPAYATDLKRKSVVNTRYGALDSAPLPGQRIIPPNLGAAPSRFAINLRLVKAFALGKKEIVSQAPSGSAENGKSMASIYKNAWRPLYAIRFELIAKNVFNHPNLGLPVGNLSSSFFGNSISLAGSPFSTTAADRQIVLRAVFRF